MFYKILRSCWDPVKNCWPSWRNALHQYDFLTERYRTLLCTSFVKINTAWNSILHMGLKVLIYLQILLHMNSFGITWTVLEGFFHSCWNDLWLKVFWFQISLRRPDVCSDGVLSLSCSCCRVSSRVFPVLLLIQLFLGRQVHCLACSPWRTEPPWRAPVHSPKERVHVNKHLISQ